MICTFYSFKGGVGRSMALANVAELLCRRGLKVLMVDFDLEAPGLERYFNVKKDNSFSEHALGMRGVIDMLASYKELRSFSPAIPPTMTSPGDEPDAPNFAHSVEPMASFIVPIYERTDKGGKLSLMPAGNRRDPDFSAYARRVLGFSWNDFYQQNEGEAFFDWLRQELLRDWNVVLVDSRTGVTEMGGVCTHQLADVVVSFVATNAQNLEGTKMMARSLTKPDLVSVGRKGRPLHLLFVPARVEATEEDKHDEFALEFDKELGPMFPRQFVFDKGPFVDLKLSYVPAYSYLERVAVREPDRASKVDLIGAFERLGSKIAQLAPPGKPFYESYFPTLSPDEALAARAEAAFVALDDGQQLAAREAISRLLSAADGGSRRVKRDEIPENARPVLGALIDAQIVSGDQELDVNPRLREAWRRVPTWLAEDRDFLTWRDQLGSLAKYWETSGRSPDLLLSGQPLNEANRWRASHGARLNALEQNFIAKGGSTERTTVQVVKRAATLERTLKVMAVAVPAVVLAVAAGWAIYTRGQSYQISTARASLAKLVADSPDPQAATSWPTILAAIGDGDQAIAAARALPDPQAQRQSLQGVAQWLAERATTSAQAAQAIDATKPFPAGLARVAVFLQKRFPTEATVAAGQAVDVALTQDTAVQVATLSDVAQILLDGGLCDQPRRAMIEAMKRLSTISDPDDRANARLRVSSLLGRAGAANEAVQTLIDFNDRISNMRGTAQLAEDLARTGNYERARPLANTVREELPRLGLDNDLADVVRAQLATTFARVGSFADAIAVAEEMQSMDTKFQVLREIADLPKLRGKPANIDIARAANRAAASLDTPRIGESLVMLARAGAPDQAAVQLNRLTNPPPGQSAAPSAAPSPSEPDRSALVANVWTEISKGYAAKGQKDDAAKAARNALQSTESIEDPVTRASVLEALLTAYRSDDPRQPDPFKIKDSLLAAARGITDPRAKVSVLVDVAQALDARGDKTEARSIGRDAVRTASAIEAVGDRGHTIVETARAMWELGIATDVIDAAKKIDDAQVRADALVAIARISIRANQLESARVTLQSANEAAAAISDENLKSAALSNVAKAFAAAGDFRQARLAADQSSQAEDRLNALSIVLHEFGKTRQPQMPAEPKLSAPTPGCAAASQAAK